jgi:hypothetical protein
MSPPAVIVFAGPRDRYESALALQENQALEAESMQKTLTNVPLAIYIF